MRLIKITYILEFLRVGFGWIIVLILSFLSSFLKKENLNLISCISVF